MNRKEFVGRSAAEAAIKACDELGVTRSALRYEILSETGEDIASRKVVIAVDVEATTAAGAVQDTGPARDYDDGPRGPRTRGPRSAGESRDRYARSSDSGERGGSYRGSSGRGNSRRGPPRRDDRGGPRDNRGGARNRDDEGAGIENLLNLEALPTEPRELKAEIQAEPSLRAKVGREVLDEIVNLAGFDLKPVLIEDGAEEIHFDLRGTDESRVIGKKGEALLAAQFLVNRIVARRAEGEQHVVLDAADYRNRRHQALADLAKRLAERALAEGKVVRVSPMSAHDRRVFHITLQDLGTVTTRSEGDGLFRPLLIIPSAQRSAE